MRTVIMLCYLTTALGVEYKPGDLAPRPGDETFDDAELARLVEVGGARESTEADVAAFVALQAKFGPTVAEYVAAGYSAENYPPAGYESRSTPEEIAVAIDAQKVAAEKAAAEKVAADKAAKAGK
jgi:hypothetical protein